MENNILNVIKNDENLFYITEYLNYLRAGKGCCENTIQSYYKDLMQLLDYYPLKGLLSLNESDLRDFKYYLVNTKKLKPASVNRKRSTICGFYQYFVDDERYKIVKNPARRIEKMKLPKKIPVTMNVSNAKLFLDGLLLLGTYAVRDYAIFSTFMFTGVRVDELVNLDVFDVDFSNKVIFVRHGKGDKERVVPMIPRLEKALELYLRSGTKYRKEIIKLKKKTKEVVKIDKANSGREYFKSQKNDTHLFISNKGTKFTSKGIEYLFKSYLRKLEINDAKLSLHAMRRTCLTLLFETGEVDLFTLKEISGHKNIQTLEHYLNISFQRLLEAMAKHPLANMELDLSLVNIIRERYLLGRK